MGGRAGFQRGGAIGPAADEEVVGHVEDLRPAGRLGGGEIWWYKGRVVGRGGRGGGMGAAFVLERR